MDKRNELTLPPWLQDYNRNLSPMVPDCPDGNRYQEVERLQPNPRWARYGWPGTPAPRKSLFLRKIASLMGKLAVFIAFGGGLGWLFLTRWIG